MVAEREWEHCGYRCSVSLNVLFMRCGYVDVPSGHPLFGVRYDRIDGICVHGGLTYSGMTDDGLWRLGFDCAHYTDGVDMDALSLAHENGEVSDSAFDEITRLFARICDIVGEPLIVWTGDMAAEETEHLAEQIASIGAGHGCE